MQAYLYFLPGTFYPYKSPSQSFFLFEMHSEVLMTCKTGNEQSHTFFSFVGSRHSSGGEAYPRYCSVKQGFHIHPAHLIHQMLPLCTGETREMIIVTELFECLKALDYICPLLMGQVCAVKARTCTIELFPVFHPCNTFWM